MWNVDFILGAVLGAALVGLVSFFLRVEHTEAPVRSTLGETSTWNVVSEVATADTVASSNTVLSIAPTLVSVPRRGRKPSAKKTPKKPSAKDKKAKPVKSRR